MACSYFDYKVIVYVLYLAYAHEIRFLDKPFG